MWKSQLQTEICLSLTESEYTGLSYSLRQTIPIMRLLQELQANGFPIVQKRTKVRCTVFEDNAGAIELATTIKHRPHTRHMATKLHHFQQYVEEGNIVIRHISSENQPANLLTKPLPNPKFGELRRLIMGW